MSVPKGRSNLFACLGEYYARVSKPKVKWCKNTLSNDKQTCQKVGTTLGVQSICKKYTSKGQINMSKGGNNFRSTIHLQKIH
jgi:hypothetical protein